MAAEASGTAMRRDLRDEVVTIHILRCTWGRSFLPDKPKSFSLAKLARPLRYVSRFSCQYGRVLHTADYSPPVWRGTMSSAQHPGTALAVTQQSDNLWCIDMCQALDFGDAKRNHWARNDYQTHARHTQRCRTGMGSHGKGTGDDTDRGHASGFSQNGVVETPRCAGASIRDTVNDGITLRHQRGDRLLGARGAITKLGGIDHALDPILLFEDFVQLLQEGIRVILAVFQEPDDFASDTGHRSTGATDLGR